MKTVYIASPLRGDIPGNIERAKEYAKYAFECGAGIGAPARLVAWGEEERRSKRVFRAAARKRASEVRDDEVPHFYALVLNDNEPEERELGQNAGKTLLWFCDEVWVFGDILSSGMKAEIKTKQLNVRIRYFVRKNKLFGGTQLYEKKKGF